MCNLFHKHLQRRSCGCSSFLQTTRVIVSNMPFGFSDISRIQAEPLNGEVLAVTGLSHPWCLNVSGMPSNTPKQHLILCLENSVDGAEVPDVAFINDARKEAIATFDDCDREYRLQFTFHAIFEHPICVFDPSMLMDILHSLPSQKKPRKIRRCSSSVPTPSSCSCYKYRLRTRQWASVWYDTVPGKVISFTDSDM